LCIVFLLSVSSLVKAQIKDIELGKSRENSGLFDFSDPGVFNIKVAVWGYVSRPGKYIVPDYTTVSDLLSYAGGPYQDAEMDDLRLYRVLENGTEEMIKFSYNDIMWESSLSSKVRVAPKLKASDILVVPGNPKLFFRDWFNIGIQVFSVVLTLVNLVILVGLNK
jgi:protein involved in polysaccharide export with SLBB domain